MRLDTVAAHPGHRGILHATVMAELGSMHWGAAARRQKRQSRWHPGMLREYFWATSLRVFLWQPQEMMKSMGLGGLGTSSFLLQASPLPGSLDTVSATHRSSVCFVPVTWRSPAATSACTLFSLCTAPCCFCLQQSAPLKCLTLSSFPPP